MISVLVTILVLCLIFGLIWWIVSLLPLPPPFGQVARVVVAVIFLLIVLYELLPLVNLHPALR